MRLAGLAELTLSHAAVFAVDSLSPGPAPTRARGPPWLPDHGRALPRARAYRPAGNSSSTPALTASPTQGRCNSLTLPTLSESRLPRRGPISTGRPFGTSLAARRRREVCFPRGGF